METQQEKAQQEKEKKTTQPRSLRELSHAELWHKLYPGRPPLLIGNVERVVLAYSRVVDLRGDQQEGESLATNQSPSFCFPPVAAHGAEGLYTTSDAARDMLTLLLYVQQLEAKFEGYAENEELMVEWLCKSQREAGAARAQLEALLEHGGPKPKDVQPTAPHSCHEFQQELHFGELLGDEPASTTD